MTSKRALAALVGVAAVIGLAGMVQGGEFFFKDGDVVVVLGDSITEQHLYSSYLEAWTVCRFPTWKITFRNVGIGGDTSPGGESRFKRDVLFRKPTALTVDFGMNDGGYGAFNQQGYDRYVRGLEGIAQQAKGANIRVAWLTPSPFERKEDGPAAEGYNQTLERFSEGVKEVAAANDGLFIDQLHPYIAAMDKARAAKAANRIGGGDAVHPGPPGQALMAWAILKGMNFPNLVVSADIDAAAGKAAGTQGCKITGLKAAAGGVQFQQQDEGLPFSPAEAKSILQWAPVLEDLNEYRLKVTGLKAGQYEIRLGGKKVAQYSDGDLSTGVNLTAAVLADGPIAEQVHTVWSALTAKNAFHHDRIFRGIVLSPVNVPDWLDLKLTPQQIESQRQAAIEKRLAELTKYDEALRKALVIVPHEVQIVPVQK